MTDSDEEHSDPAQGVTATDTLPPATPRDERTPVQFDGERIAKAIARAGIASRRDAEALILAGRVTLNGALLDSPAVNVTDSDRITVDGEPLPARERTRLWILHKPRGVVTTARDPEGRQTVFDGLPEDLPRVVAIGRLDINTEGLLLLTNDGGLAKVIAHPETGWLRRYRVRAFGEISQPELDKLRKGVTIDGMEYGPVEASLDRSQGDNVWLTLGLREGKNREVKRILEYLGLSVNRLIRLSFGPFQLGDLEVGLVEEVRTKVLKEQLGKNLAEQAGVDFESPVREPIAPFGKPSKPAASGVARQSPPPKRESNRGPRLASNGRSERSGRPGRDPARPPTPTRVPTGGMGPGPRQSIWRADDEAESGRPHGTRIPRRGSDPKTARAAAAERERERVGAIKSGDRRVLVERLQPTPEKPAAEPHRRVKFRRLDETGSDGGEARKEGRGRERVEPREPRERRAPPRDRRAEVDRRPSGGQLGPHADDRRPSDNRAPRGDEPPRRERVPRSDAGPRMDRAERPSGGRTGAFGKGKPASSSKGRGFEDRKQEGRPSGGRPSGFGSGKPAADRNGRKFDGRKSADRPRPGGSKPGPRGQRPPPRGGR